MERMKQAFSLWRCPKCGDRWWSSEPKGHVPSSHNRPVDSLRERCGGLYEKVADVAALTATDEGRNG